MNKVYHKTTYKFLMSMVITATAPSNWNNLSSGSVRQSNMGTNNNYDKETSATTSKPARQRKDETTSMQNQSNKQQWQCHHQQHYNHHWQHQLPTVTTTWESMWLIQYQHCCIPGHNANGRNANNKMPTTQTCQLLKVADYPPADHLMLSLQLQTTAWISRRLIGAAITMTTINSKHINPSAPVIRYHKTMLRMVTEFITSGQQNQQTQS